MKSIISAVLMAILMTGCAFNAHNANVEIDQAQINPVIGADSITLFLRVLDEREETDLGRRGAGIGVAKVEAEGLIPRFTRAVEEGFVSKGYSLTSDRTEADAELDVILRTLRFEESAGFFTVGAEADATILAEAEKGSLDYRNQYRFSDEDRQLAVSFGGGIDEQLSLVMNEVLAQLFGDSELDDFLLD